MELKLNVYKQGQVEKEYIADTFNIMFGTIEDLMNVLDLDKILNGNDTEFIKSVALSIPKVFDTVKYLLKDIFLGITDEELRRTRVIDLAKIIVAVVKYTISEINEGETQKN